MENHFKFERETVDSKKILEIIKSYKESSNKDLNLALQFIQKDFEHTKETLLKLSEHLDKLENTYNMLHKEYTNRLKNG
jgi:prefoldin subunit 5